AFEVVALAGEDDLLSLLQSQVGAVERDDVALNDVEDRRPGERKRFALRERRGVAQLEVDVERLGRFHREPRDFGADGVVAARDLDLILDLERLYARGPARRGRGQNEPALFDDARIGVVEIDRAPAAD